MAEVFGIMTGALSVAALFNNCVDCFEYVHIGRNFGQDFERCQLKLDIAQNRLCRWGQTVRINEDPQYGAKFSGQLPPTAQLSKRILIDLYGLFAKAREITQKYQKTANQLEMSNSCTRLELSGPFRNLHDIFHQRSAQRSRQVGLLQKASWALHDKNQFDKLLQTVIEHVQGLENLPLTRNPPDQTLMSFTVQEVREFENDETSLRLLQENSTNTDPDLKRQVDEQIQSLYSGHKTGNLTATEQGRIRTGDEFSDVAVRQNFQPLHGTRHTVEDVAAHDSGRIHVGNKFGGPGIMD